MNDSEKVKIQGVGWLVAFLLTGVIAAGFAINQLEELVSDLIGGLWSELRSDFLGFLTSYTWGINTFIELFFNILFLFLIVLLPLLFFRQFLKRNSTFDFGSSRNWLVWCRGLLIVSGLSLTLHLFSIWQTRIAFEEGESLSFSARQWEIVSVSLAFTWIVSLFLAIFQVSAISNSSNRRASWIKSATYWFAVISIVIFVLGRAFTPSLTTKEEILNEYSFARTTPATVTYAQVCAQWITLKNSYKSLNMYNSPTSVVEQGLEEVQALELILLEGLYHLQLKDETWLAVYSSHGLTRAFVDEEGVRSVLPAEEVDRLSDGARKMSLEEVTDLLLPFLRYMDDRCPTPPGD